MVQLLLQLTSFATLLIYTAVTAPLSSQQIITLKYPQRFSFISNKPFLKMWRIWPLLNLLLRSPSQPDP